MIVRRAQAKDAPILAKAQKEIAKVPGYFCSQPSELTSENVQATISTLHKNRGLYIVAEIEGQLVGHAFLEPLHPQALSHVAELTVVVHKGWQEKGIGSRLMKELIAYAKSSQWIERIELWVRASNERAISLYKKIGFQEEGRLKKRVKVGNRYFDDIVMALYMLENQESQIPFFLESDKRE